MHARAGLARPCLLNWPLLGTNNPTRPPFEGPLAPPGNLARHVPEARLFTPEGGLFPPADLADVARYGARCFLIGESLMRADDVATATRTILANPLTAQGGI